MSRYKDFSTAVCDCLKRSASLWQFPGYDPNAHTFDLAIDFFIARLDLVKQEIEALRSDDTLGHFLGLYAPLPSELTKRDCGSYHHLALSDAENNFRYIMDVVQREEREDCSRPPPIEPRPPIADISIDPQQIEDRWDAVWHAAYSAERGSNWREVLLQLANELTIKERQDVKELAEAESKSDGPIPPDGFRHNGKTLDGLARQPFLALQYLWLQTGRAATKEELAEPVLGDCEEFVDASQLHNIRRDLNAFFKSHSLPYKATVANDFLAVKDAPPQSAKVSRKPPKKPTPRRPRR